jgi:hypothetical protein
LELDGIVNSTIPKDFNTSGYSVDIKTLSDEGRVLETMTSMPFFIRDQGKYVIRGLVQSGGTGLNGVEIFGGSPMTGPLSAITQNQDCGSGAADGCYIISGLPEGDYMIHPESSVTVGGTDYISEMPQPIFINDSTTQDASGGACDSSDSVCYYTKNFDLATAASKPSITVKVVGTFSNDDVDIFAGGPNGFNVKTVTLNGTYSSGSPYSTTFYLPGNGSYMVGIGPAMPKGPMPMGPPPMPNWMPPPTRRSKCFRRHSQPDRGNLYCIQC